MAIFSLESFKRRPENWELLDRTLNYENRADWVAAQMHKTNTPHVIIAAHRGDWRNYPENSLPSIESVIRMGADIMELDLKMTKDSVLVLSHDVTVDRCTDGTGKVSDDKLAAAVQKVFDLRPSAIIRELDLRRPIYRQLAAYGHV